MVLIVGSSAFAASASSPDGVDEHIINNSSYWNGQTLAFSDSITGDQTYNLFIDDEFATQIVANDGQIVFDTGEYAVGSYELRQGGDLKAEFAVYQQNLDISANPDAEFDDKDDSTEFKFNSNRAQFNVTVTSEQLPDRRVADMFEPARSDSRDSLAQEPSGFKINNIESSESINVTFDGLDGDDKVLDFEVRDTGDTESLQLSEGTDKQTDVSFTQDKYVETVGDKIQIFVEFSNTDTTELRFTDGAYDANLTLTDNNEDGVVGVELSTMGAGQQTNGNYVETLGNVDAVENNTESSLGRQLDVGNYELSLRNNAGRLQGTAVASLIQQTEPTVSVHTLPQKDDLTLKAVKQDATQTDQVAIDDYLIFNVTADGIHAPLPVEGDPQKLTEGGQFEDEYGIFAGVQEVEPEVNQDREQIPASSAETFYTQADTDSLYLVYRAGAGAFSIDDDDINPGDQQIDIEDVYELEFEMTANSPYFERDGYHSGTDSRNITKSFDIAERTVVPQLPEVRIEQSAGIVTVDKLFMTNSSDESVVANTTMAPGTTILTGLRVGQRDAFATKTAEVQSTRQLENTFDLSGSTPTDEMTLSYNPPNTVYEVALRSPNDPPEVTSFSVADQLRVGEQAQLSAEATDDGADAELSYEWVFDDGDTKSGRVVSETFDTPGSYEVTVRVADGQNVIVEDSATVDVVTVPPTVEVSTSSQQLTAGESVTFSSDVTDSDGGQYSYDWGSDAGGSSTDETFTETFEQPGSYEVNVVITDQEDRTAQDSVTVTVSEPETDATEETNATDSTDSTSTPNQPEEESSGIVSRILDFLPFL